MLVIDQKNFESEVIKSDIPVLVDFYANWCSPCRMVSPLVDALADEYKGKLKVAKLDVDASPEIAVKYKVMSIPTLIFFKGGKESAKLIGAAPKQVIEEQIRSVLS